MLLNDEEAAPDYFLVRTDQHVRYGSHLYRPLHQHSKQACRKLGLHNFQQRFWMGHRILLPALISFSCMGHDRLRWHYTHVRGDH